MLGKNIRFFREKRGLTQEQMAGKLSISPQAISKWEREESLPDCSILPRLSQVLQVSLDHLFNQSSPTLEDVVYQISNYVETLPEKEKFQIPRLMALACELGNHTMDFLPDCKNSIRIESEYGINFSSNRPELPFYGLFIEPVQGWKNSLKGEDFDCFFEGMADKEVRRILFSLYETSGLTFDEAYAKIRFGLKNPFPVLKKLVSLGILRTEHIHIDGAVKQMWNFVPHCGLIALLCVLNEFLYHNQSFDIGRQGRRSEYLR